MATQKFTNFGKFFLMHADMTSVTMQSSKITGAILWKKSNFLANPID